MVVILISLHIILFSVALGGRVLFIPNLRKSALDSQGERLERVLEALETTKWADIALFGALVSGFLLLSLDHQSFAEIHWAMKLKLITLFLLIIDLSAFYLAQVRIRNHYDIHMIPIISRLNQLAVIFMCCMVFFASFTIN